MSVLTADNKRALNILRLVTEQVEELESAKLEILMLREANTLVILENGRLLYEVSCLRAAATIGSVT